MIFVVILVIDVIEDGFSYFGRSKPDQVVGLGFYPYCSQQLFRKYLFNPSHLMTNLLFRIFPIYKYH